MNSAADKSDRNRTYDRAFLLSEKKRNTILDLQEVQQYGIDSYSDPDYVSLYGLTPRQWHQKGIRILARTAVECVKDELGKKIGHDVRAIIESGEIGQNVTFVDPFAGSCNSLHWILANSGTDHGLAFETDETIYSLTKTSLQLVRSPISLINGDFFSSTLDLSFGASDLVVIYVAPPWGEALSETTGLDLQLTSPPVGQIIKSISERYVGRKLLFVVQVHESIVRSSLSYIETWLDWSSLTIYDEHPPGNNHGILLGTQGWHPRKHTS